MTKRIVVKINTGDSKMDERIEVELKATLWDFFQNYFGVSISKEDISE